MADMWQNWSSGSDNPNPGSRYNTQGGGGGGMWGLESLGTGLSNLSAGPGGRERSRERREAKEYAQTSLIWKANQLKQLGINPAIMSGSEGSKYTATAGGGGVNKIGKGLGQLGNTLINRLANKETRTLQNDSIRADINYKNASAQAIRSGTGDRNAGNKASDEVVINPSETTSSSRRNPGVEMGAKTGDAFSVRSDRTIKVHPNQELAEALESQGIIDSGADALNDAQTFVRRAHNSSGEREKLRKTAINTLRKTGKLKPGETLYWVISRQRFQIKKLRSMKHYTRSRRPVKNWINKRKRYPRGKFLENY